MIRRLLIANRGEIAVRIIRACRELGIETVAVHSDADAGSPYTLAADRAISIGPAPAAESYLSIPRIIQAAQHAGADAIHPGYGFLSENAAFAEACVRARLRFIGPPAAVIARMGSKIQARALVARAGVPVVPGESPADQSDAALQAALNRLGFPALVKASAGGGGKGMRRVNTASDALDAIQAARREALGAFSDGTLYVERLIEMPHHVEVQVFADDHGHVVHLFERDCSVQRRHQKVIEESPSPIVSPGLRERITTAAVTAARAAAYRNAGTMEFLVDAARSNKPFYFLEMNTRLQVEHPVTEQVTGTDLVRAQLLVASGDPLPWSQSDLTQRGHAIEARVYAEDPAQGFLPQAGTITGYRAPHLPGVRIDSGVAEGSRIPIYYDSMIAKVIATAETRPLAINRLIAALKEFDIDGIRTNVPFLIRILDLPEFRAGTIDTAFLDRKSADLTKGIEESPTTDGRRTPARAAAPAVAGYDPWDPGGRVIEAKTASSSPTATRSKRALAGTSQLAAPMPATVIKVRVKAGDTVKKGDVVVLLEAMKMELPVRSPADAVVKAVLCSEGELVQADTTLLELE